MNCTACPPASGAPRAARPGRAPRGAGAAYGTAHPGAAEGSAIDQLIGFSEVALALAGFAAIALVLGRREGVLPTGSAFVVQFMVINTLGPAVLALLGVVLYELGIPEPALWRLCSAFYLVGAAGGVAASLLREREIARGGELAMPPWFRRVGWGFSIVAHGIELVNFVGLPFGPSLGLFLLGLWVLIALGALQFVVLLFSTLR